MDLETKLARKTYRQRRKEWIDYALKTRNERLFKELSSRCWRNYIGTRYQMVEDLLRKVEYEQDNI